MTLQRFYEELERHDWYYELSDDHRVYMAGSDNGQRLEKIARLFGPKYETLLEDYKNYAYSGPIWNKPMGAKKPEKPKET